MLVNELHQGGIRALLAYDNTIFDDMVVPEDMDPNDIIDRIIYKYGDTPLFTPDPSVIKFYIGRWSRRRLSLWERYKAAIELEYNPIENYDRTEKETLDHGLKVSHTGTVTDAPSGIITDSVDRTQEQLRAADNASTYQPMDKETSTGKSNERTFTNYQEQRTYNNDDTNSGKDIRDVHVHGNIGVLTSQAMLTSEVDLIRDNLLDLIDYIADDWHAEFCLLMYV